MKKYEFDNEPQLLEQEGSTMRISFDVEQAIVPIPSMSGEQAGERTIYKAAVVRVPIPMKAERIVAAVIAAGGDMLKANVVAAEALFADSGCSDLMLAKNFKTAKINEYDKSTAVNEFFLNGDSMWIPREDREALMRRFEAEKSAGRTTTNINQMGRVYTLPIDTAISMMNQLEVYAADSFDCTQAHLGSVAALETVSEVVAYDYTTGYPPKLSF